MITSGDIIGRLFSADLYKWSLFHQNENPELFSNVFTMIFIEFDGGGKLVLVSDTSPFINFYIEKPDYQNFLKEIFDYLDVNGKNVLFDTNHYEVLEASIKLPHFGMILLETLNNYIWDIKSTYTSFFGDNSLILLGSILMISVSMFAGLRRYLKIRDEAGLAIGDVVEKEMIISPDLLIPLRHMYGEDFKEFIKNAYGLLNIMLKDNLGVTADYIISNRESFHREVFEAVDYITKIYVKVNRPIIFPPIFNKKAVVRRVLSYLSRLANLYGGI